MFDTFDCLAAADVLVGSESSFSEAAGALSTNVKVLVWLQQTEQDRVTLNHGMVASSGAVSSEKQSQVDAAISDWWHCSGKSLQSEKSDAENVAARGYYQTVDGHV